MIYTIIQAKAIKYLPLTAVKVQAVKAPKSTLDQVSRRRSTVK